MQKIVTCLAFNNQAEEAVNFYVSAFPNSRILTTNRYGDAGPGPQGSVLSVQFVLNGQEFFALNGGPYFKFSEGISLFVNCETQAEVDTLWEKLSEGGEKGQCGWLKDKYGVSWQIVPTALGRLLQDPDPERSQSVMKAMLQMTKIEIDELERAYAKV